MTSFFKVFFQGILYILLLPFFLLLLAIYFVYCLLVFIYIGIRCIIIFFAGGYPLGDLPEDVKAKEILAKQIENSLVLQNQYVQQPQQYSQYNELQSNNEQNQHFYNQYQEPSLDSSSTTAEDYPMDNNENNNNGGESL